MAFLRQGGRCPARDFLDRECHKAERKKLLGSFQSIVVTTGPKYHNPQRFTPLHGEAGKPLWEFKEHDHRLYCLRVVDGTVVEIVLFNGWIKDKDGKSQEEAREITKAQNLLSEYRNER
jgi:hypothetical protein